MINSAAIDQEPAFIEVGEGDGRRRIAVRARTGGSPGSTNGAPGLFWLGGFNSDMRGTKALALDEWAAAHRRACVRFDYSGHGESGGAFIDGTIGRWLEESVAVFARFCRGPQVVIGSSMGGWMALLLAREIAKREASQAASQASQASLAGLVLIAPAPDFTEQLMWNNFTPEIQQEIQAKGVWMRPSQYGDGAPYPITRATLRVAMVLGGHMDEDKAVARTKWAVDWLVQRRYLHSDRRTCLTRDGYPTQRVTRKEPATLTLTLTPELP